MFATLLFDVSRELPTYEHQPNYLYGYNISIINLRKNAE